MRPAAAAVAVTPGTPSPAAAASAGARPDAAPQSASSCTPEAQGRGHNAKSS